MKGAILRAGVWVIASVVVVGASTMVYTSAPPLPSPTPIASLPTRPPSFAPPTLVPSPQPTAEPTPEPTAEPTPLPTPVPPVIVSLPPLPTSTPLPLPTLPPVPTASICLFPPSCGRSVPPRVCLPNPPPPCK